MNVLIDTGPLVAYFDRRDPWHRWISQQMGAITTGLFTCEAVISEVCFILQREGLSPAPVFNMIEKKVLTVDPACTTQQSQQRIAEIIDTYNNLPASFADACLIHRYESIRVAKVFTLDDHFTIYRTSEGNTLSLIIPS